MSDTPPADELPRHGFWPSAQDKDICGRWGCSTLRSHPIHLDNDTPPADPCPDCDGHGILGIDLGEDWGDCDTCDGTGTVDGIPPDLIGVGSVLETAMGNRVTIVSRHWAKHGAWRVYDDDDGAFVLGVVADEDIGPGRPWRVVRAVPPDEEPTDG